MSEYDYDLCVIGGGSGGVRAARFAANEGYRVALIEERYLGGTCVNVGCVPKKLFVYASEFSESYDDACGYGWSKQKPSFEWKTLVENKDHEISRLNKIYESLLEGANVTVIEGHGRLTSPQHIEIGDRKISSEKILIATGGWPFIPKFPGSELALHSNHMFYLKALPKRMAIVGGGYIAAEFACIFHGLGVEVTILQRGEKILKSFDAEISSHVASEMKAKGITIKTNSQIKEIKKSAQYDQSSAQGFVAELIDGEQIETDLIFFATGRKPLVENLGLENAGVALAKNNSIIVDKHFQTNIPSVYAIGDVIGRVQLTPVATAEAMIFVKNMSNKAEKVVLDYQLIATAVFTQPNIGTVGLSEEEAVKQYGNIDVYTSKFKAMKNTLSGREEKTLMKLVVNRDTDRVLGVHMAGHDAGEIIQGMAVALKSGASKANFDNTIGIHPTSAEEFVTMRSLSRSYP